MTETDYESGYEAGLRCDPVPDDASNEWQLGYVAALDVEIVVLRRVEHEE